MAGRLAATHGSSTGEARRSFTGIRTRYIVVTPTMSAGWCRFSASFVTSVAGRFLKLLCRVG